MNDPALYDRAKQIAEDAQATVANVREVSAEARRAIADFRLTDAERRALLAGDVGALAQMGAHGYVLGALARHQVLGLTMQNYVERIHEPGKVA